MQTQRFTNTAVWILLMFGVSSFAQTTSPPDARLQARDLDGDATTIEAYFDAELNITWLKDTNIGKSQTFGLQRAPITDYGFEVDENGAMLRGALTAFIAGMNQNNYLGFSAWRLPTALSGGDDGCDVQLDDGALTWGSGCNGPEVGSLNAHLEAQYGGIESSPFINVVVDGPWHDNERWLGSGGPAGRHFYRFGGEGDLRFCGAGRCIRGFVWPVHDGDIGTPVNRAACIDTDGDGWGWNGIGSCFILLPPAGECIDTLPLNDGWGWDGAASCSIEVIKPVCVDTLPVGDGWGWDGVQSCRIDAMPTCVDSPPIGDGWGWDGVQSCRIETTCYDSPPVGDGWGWDGTQSCRISNVKLQRIDGDIPSTRAHAQYLPFNSDDIMFYSQGDSG